MITASVLNEAGCSTSSVVLSKSTVHRQCQNVVKKLPKKQKRTTTSQIGQSVLYPGMERSYLICLGRRARRIDCLFYLPHWKMVVKDAGSAKVVFICRSELYI